MFSDVYPDIKFLKISTIGSSLLGIFPEEYMFKKNKQYRKIYGIYSYFTLAFFMFFTLLFYIQFFFIVTADVIKFDELGRNLSVSLNCTMTIIRVIFMRLHPDYKKLIQYIIKSEKYMFSTKDSEVKINFYLYLLHYFEHSHILYTR